MRVLRNISRKFARKEDGAVLVEFALVMPIMLLLFATTVETARMFWAYQQTIAGVRDASRYFGRAAPFDICTQALGPWNTKMLDIVRNKHRGFGSTDSATTVFGGDIAVLSVTSSLNCIDDDGDGGASDFYAADRVVIGTVTANVQITLPWGGVFELFGNGISSVTTSVSDQVRIYGQ